VVFLIVFVVGATVSVARNVDCEAAVLISKNRKEFPVGFADGKPLF
jgi:hypothetical protein